MKQTIGQLKRKDVFFALSQSLSFKFTFYIPLVVTSILIVYLSSFSHELNYYAMGSMLLVSEMLRIGSINFVKNKFTKSSHSLKDFFFIFKSPKLFLKLLIYVVVVTTITIGFMYGLSFFLSFTNDPETPFHRLVVKVFSTLIHATMVFLPFIYFFQNAKFVESFVLTLKAFSKNILFFMAYALVVSIATMIGTVLIPNNFGIHLDLLTKAILLPVFIVFEFQIFRRVFLEQQN